MRQRFNTRQRNYIILGLCSILLIMAAWYAAFSSRLTINGTSNITSEWKVLITDIQSEVLSENATLHDYMAYNATLHDYMAYNALDTYPVSYINSAVKFLGSGTQSDPYRLS